MKKDTELNEILDKIEKIVIQPTQNTDQYDFQIYAEDDVLVVRIFHE